MSTLLRIYAEINQKLSFLNGGEHIGEDEHLDLDCYYRNEHDKGDALKQMKVVGGEES